jgi:hypothetical protein
MYQVVASFTKQVRKCTPIRSPIVPAIFLRVLTAIGSAMLKRFGIGHALVLCSSP